MPARSILSTLASLLAPRTKTDAAAPAPPMRRPAARPEATASVVSTGTETVEVEPPRTLTITYAPRRDGDPDAGEVVWTWVPYAERDGRGKDRPVLVIARHTAERVYAVRLTSRSHEGDREYLGIGGGPWDSKNRPSWVDIDQLYSVHHQGMRREASALDRTRFFAVASALHKRWGWTPQL